MVRIFDFMMQTITTILPTAQSLKEKLDLFLALTKAKADKLHGFQLNILIIKHVGGKKVMPEITRELKP